MRGKLCGSGNLAKLREEVAMRFPVEMQENKQRVYRFIEAFEKLYGRKPNPQDAQGNFRIQVAQDMQISVGGARYYLRLAAEQMEHLEEET